MAAHSLQSTTGLSEIIQIKKKIKMTISNLVESHTKAYHIYLTKRITIPYLSGASKISLFAIVGKCQCLYFIYTGILCTNIWKEKVLLGRHLIGVTAILYWIQDIWNDLDCLPKYHLCQHVLISTLPMLIIIESILSALAIENKKSIWCIPDSGETAIHLV